MKVLNNRTDEIPPDAIVISKGLYFKPAADEDVELIILPATGTDPYGTSRKLRILRAALVVASFLLGILLGYII